MSVIAQAIADRQREIDRLQTEIKALTDVERILGASVAPSSPLAHLMGAMAGSGAARRLLCRGEGRRGDRLAERLQLLNPESFTRAVVFTSTTGATPDTVTDSASVANSSAASMRMARLPSTITPSRTRVRKPGISNARFVGAAPEGAGPVRGHRYPRHRQPLRVGRRSAYLARGLGRGRCRGGQRQQRSPSPEAHPKSRQITMRSISSTVTVSAVRS